MRLQLVVGRGATRGSKKHSMMKSKKTQDDERQDQRKSKMKSKMKSKGLSQSHFCKIQLPLCEFRSLLATSIGYSSGSGDWTD
ncbi:hypothetical protein HQN89_21270 [Paenibacillus frigoriresistens]|uniref:hypothetical protein n=1 Tax=Paenibacillus alginolyticus TaxID=59839 RepID=UPI001564EC7D|nr:hypothetical protein [Paenibacillus frigoriresistens]NRF93480.1 hypothetical protein [Paenibacillus frigoriresistens]